MMDTEKCTGTKMNINLILIISVGVFFNNADETYLQQTYYIVTTKAL